MSQTAPFISVECELLQLNEGSFKDNIVNYFTAGDFRRNSQLMCLSPNPCPLPGSLLESEILIPFYTADKPSPHPYNIYTGCGMVCIATERI